MVDKLSNGIRKSNSGGATLVIGGGNTAENTLKTQIIGVNNTVKGTENKPSDYNMINAFNTTVDGASHLYTIGYRNDFQNENNSVVIGDFHQMKNGKNNVVIGSYDGNTSGSTTYLTNNGLEDAVVVGHNANATVNKGVAIGSGSIASVDKGAAGYDPNPSVGDNSADPAGTWKSTDAAVSVGKADGTMTRQITGVAAGTNATDAVNVAQLKKAMASAGKDGNDTLVAANDALSIDKGKLNLSIKDTANNTVTGSVDLSEIADAVADGNTTYEMLHKDNADNTTTITLKDSNDAETSVTVATRDTRNTVKAGDHVAVQEDKNQDGSSTYTVSVKADGRVEKGNTEIVTGGTVYNETRTTADGNYTRTANTAGENIMALDKQVKQNADAITDVDNRVTDLGSRMNRMDDRIDRVGAGAAALAALHPQDFDPDDKWDFAAGYGNYRSASAMALGAFYRPDARTMFSVGGSMGGGENMVNVGVSLKLGKASPYAGYSKAALTNVIADQKKQLDAQDGTISSLKSQNAELSEKVEKQQAQIDEILRQLAELKK